MIVAGLGVAAFFGMRWFAPKARAHLSFATGNPVVELHFAHVSDGETVRCLGRDLVVADGRVSVPVSEGTLSIGPNVFTVGVGTEEISVHLDATHWIAIDAEALRADPPRLGVVVRAARGVDVAIGDGPIGMDANGVGRWSTPIDPTEVEVERDVEVRFVAGVNVSVERIHLASSAARLDIQRPPSEFVTDRTSVTLEGLVGAGASVSLDGAPLEHHGETLTKVLDLPVIGENRFEFVATEPNHHRRVRVLIVRRVDDLARAAEAFVADPSVTFAEMSARPERVGALVDVTAQAFHVRVDAGRSIIQALVSPCEISSGCPLWVEYPAVTVARIGETVRVRGRFAGTQAYRDQTSGVELHAPRIDAAFVTGPTR